MHLLKYILLLTIFNNIIAAFCIKKVLSSADINPLNTVSYDNLDLFPFFREKYFTELLDTFQTVFFINPYHMISL